MSSLLAAVAFQFSRRKVPVHLTLCSRFPTTDGRELVFRRYTQPEKDHKILLTQLGWQLPEQAPPRITAHGGLEEPVP